MKNRFNRLTSKEWLPFQKSWFKYETEEKFISENIRFFSKAEAENSVVLYDGHSCEVIDKVCKENNINYRLSFDNNRAEQVQYALIDLRDCITSDTTLEQYLELKKNVIERIVTIYHRIEHRRFISILIKNIQHNNHFYPFAWDMAKEVASILSLKDEKIACLPEKQSTVDIANTKNFTPAKEAFYCLHFRKDENSAGKYSPSTTTLFKNNAQQSSSIRFENVIPKWFILKPQRRKKNEILHPAKYPEELVTMFINEFSTENDNIFDPMSGTGSTQLGAIMLNRKGYGTELSNFFTEIAISRCNDYIENQHDKEQPGFLILNKDVRLVERNDFPTIDYVLTSPPYWDMLNAKGAENQAKRIKKGLQTNYSDDKQDLGNVADYQQFLKELSEIYFELIKLVKPGGYITIVVKNIKKKGKNYPFAWDLCNILQKELILLPEAFWCQDDISIAPYGFGNTWVSNTFHHYCLNFQKPL